jgi:hypothetical protein
VHTRTVIAPKAATLLAGARANYVATTRRGVQTMISHFWRARIWFGEKLFTFKTHDFVFGGSTTPEIVFDGQGKAFILLASKLEPKIWMLNLFGTLNWRAKFWRL